MEGLNLSNEVSTNQRYLWKNPTDTDFDIRTSYSEKSKKFKIVAIDLELKNQF